MGIESLGPLEPLLSEYLDVIAEAPMDPVRVSYNEQVLLDKMAAAQKSVPMDATPEEKVAHLEAAHYREISGEDAALTAAGFAGTAAKLFKKFVELEDTQEESPERNELLTKLAVLSTVSQEQQKSATIYGDGYYWGGQFTKVITNS